MPKAIPHAQIDIAAVESDATFVNVYAGQLSVVGRYDFHRGVRYFPAYQAGLSMLLYVLVGIVVVVVILIILVASLPADFRIERSTTMAAPAEKIFGHVNDLHQWNDWSPWAKVDPTMSQEYAGPGSGVGASYAWSGNNKVGQGQMTIVESQMPQRVQIRLAFLKPFQATNMSEFTFTPQAAGTLVNWSMTGHNNFMGKLFGLLMNMDKMVGKDFEKGLASLKSVSEVA